MGKISLAGFKDPVRRPRFIIWTFVLVLMLAAFVVVALGVTSTYWFCAEGCHKVQDDTIIAYEHSTHSEISCMACHMPVNADPITFVLHKMEALLELYMTVTDKYELPLNAESLVSLEMKAKQCTQCHNLKNREVTPSPGIKIDHEAHDTIELPCTVCHNRIAHKEDFELTLKDPNTGENHKHPDYMTMTACFRCHSLEKDAAAPGACAACHSPEFQLKPASHGEKDFYPKGHAEMAKEMKAESAEAAAEHAKELAANGEKAEPVSEVLEAQKNAKGEEAAHGEGVVWEKLPTVKSVFYCSTCHTEQFCSNCHGMEMPHSAAFMEPKDAKDPAGHPVIAKKLAAKCVMCHGDNKKTHFCDSCHHGEKVGFEYDAKVVWTTQHPKAVAKSGVKSCTESCHVVKFCVDCHTGRKVVPTSHRAGAWMTPKAKTMTVYGTAAAKPTAQHAVDAQKSIESCGVCHGAGGANAVFCKGCHKLEMPHPAQFKEFHAKSKSTPGTCTTCHSWKELCSNCHHVGSSLTVPWASVHGGSVNKSGAAGCLEKCHKKPDCVKCHQARKVVPASHKSGLFVRNFTATDSQHVQSFTKSGDVCTYCHAGEVADLPNSAYCKNCHKLTMPHQINDSDAQKFPHKEAFAKKGISRAQCTNCHQVTFCNACHHKGSVATAPWLRYHPNIVKKDGAEGCFECHKEVYCSNCHVNLAKRGLLN